VKKLLTVALLLLWAVFAQAQMGSPPGVPASALSITPRNPTPGVPPSVTSYSSFHPPNGAPMSPTLGFNIWNQPPRYGPIFNQNQFGASGGFGVGFGGGRFRHHHHRPVVAVPYGYAYPVYVPVEPDQEYAEPAPNPADEPSGNAFEREMMLRAAESSDRSLDRREAAPAGEPDSRYGEHYLDAREPRREPAPRAPEAPQPPAPPETSVILVLHDGARVELSNYAIFGPTIYDLAHPGKKIQVADLDLSATQKANDDRGFDFKLPATR